MLSLRLASHPSSSSEAPERPAAGARQDRIGHLVLLSGRGEAAQQPERVVQSCGLGWTIVQTASFAQNFTERNFADDIASGVVALPGSPTECSGRSAGRREISQTSHVISRTLSESASLDTHDRTQTHPCHLADYQRRQVGAGRGGRQPGRAGPRGTGKCGPRGSAATTWAAHRGTRRCASGRARTPTPSAVGARNPGGPGSLRKWVGAAGLPAGCVAPSQGPVRSCRYARRPDALLGSAARRRSGAEAAARIRLDERAGIRDHRAARGQRAQAGPAARIRETVRPAARVRPARGAPARPGGASPRDSGARAGPVPAGSLASTPAAAAAAFLGSWETAPSS
jgi:hypothetical protein